MARVPSRRRRGGRRGGNRHLGIALPGDVEGAAVWERHRDCIVEACVAEREVARFACLASGDWAEVAAAACSFDPERRGCGQDATDLPRWGLLILGVGVWVAGGGVVARRRHTPEQIIGLPREAEVALAQGQSVAQVCRALGVTGVDVLPLAQRGAVARGSPRLDGLGRLEERRCVAVWRRPA